MNAFLEGNQWIAGDTITIADFSTVATASTTNLLVPIDAKIYPNVAKWFAKMQEHPTFEVSRAGLQEAKEMFENALKK